MVEKAELTMINTPTFDNPPIVELVIGAQFAPVSKLSSAYYGLFWKKLGHENTFDELNQGALYYSKPDRKYQTNSRNSAFEEFEPQSQSKSWTDLILDINDIRNFSDDWDGDGAVAPRPQVIEAAISFAQFLRSMKWLPASSAHASVNGTIYLEWNLPSLYLEIEIISACEVEGRLLKRGATEPIIHKFD